jgi:hypothetical protein
MSSLREALRKLDLPQDFSLHTHLHSWPPSLAELIRIMNLPAPDLRQLHWHKIHGYTSDDAQGVVNAADSTWFLSSKSELRRFEITGADPNNPAQIVQTGRIQLQQLIAQTDLTGNDLLVDHMGDLAFGRNLLFIPLQQNANELSGPKFVLGVDRSFRVVGYNRLAAEARPSWCAFNDWNGLLYMSHRDDDTRWPAFDVSGFVQRVGDETAWGREVIMNRRSERDFHLRRADGVAAHLKQTQGIAFSPFGAVYATRYNGSGPWDNFVEAFSSLTGKRFSDAQTPVFNGSTYVVSPVPAGIRFINFSGVADEIEGVGFHPSGRVMYLTVADHDLVGGDDYELYAFTSDGRLG